MASYNLFPSSPPSTTLFTIISCSIIECPLTWSLIEFNLNKWKCNYLGVIHCWWSRGGVGGGGVWLKVRWIVFLLSHVYYFPLNLWNYTFRGKFCSEPFCFYLLFIKPSTRCDYNNNNPALFTLIPRNGKCNYSSFFLYFLCSGKKITGYVILVTTHLKFILDIVQSTLTTVSIYSLSSHRRPPTHGRDRDG